MTTHTCDKNQLNKNATVFIQDCVVKDPEGYAVDKYRQYTDFNQGIIRSQVNDALQPKGGKLVNIATGGDRIGR